VSHAASSTEKDVATMPTQKVFKQRVRTRMTKTGESYTAARRQLLHKASTTPPGAANPEPVSDEATPNVDDLLMTSDDAMRRGSGKGHEEWFALLDAWGATAHGHTEIATWLREGQGVPGWWAQNITVNYERARGMRRRHEQRNGFSVGASRTVAVEPDIALAAFTIPAIRRRWLPEPPIRQRPTRAVRTARFDWPEPPSRLVVTVDPKGGGRSVVAIAHEQIPDAEAAERLKAAWRKALGVLKATLERA
jgi:hypothetical protein